MSSKSVQAMLQHERNILENNIERLQDGIHADTKLGISVEGQEQILKTQQTRLADIEHLLETANDYAAALDFCRSHVMAAELKHRRAAEHDLLDLTKAHSDLWWNSLQEISYYGELFRRIEVWKHQHELEEVDPHSS